jgi:predicted RNA-binding protein YlqC (UPF0109 family)
MSSEERGRSSYLDLLITTLMEHEKNLDALVGKIGQIYENLRAVYEEAGSKQRKVVSVRRKGKKAEAEPDTLVYMKINLDRELDDIIRIIESLKE